MIRAFISHIDVGSDLDLMSFASEVNDDLIAAGYDAKSTLPWNAPELGAVTPPILTPPPTAPFVPPSPATYNPTAPTAPTTTF